MPLDVPTMTEPILANFDKHADRLVRFLSSLDCSLAYEGPANVRDNIHEKKSYACSIRLRRRRRSLRNTFPIMIGSRLDSAVRHRNMTDFEGGIPSRLDEERPPFSPLDVGTGFFVINGSLRQLPYLFANDPTNVHVTKDRSVRCYSYDACDRGKQLSYETDRFPDELMVTHNDGSKTGFESRGFFDHCPYPVDMVPYMSRVFKENNFDIDHFGNKIVYSPGHLFSRLVIKYLYGPLRDGDWPAIKSKANLITKSIESGNLLHVLSRKTVYFKEGGVGGGKMVTLPNASHREIGANGETYMEKSTGCYREVNAQTYPLNPYLVSMIVRQVSNKVKSTCAFHSSYVGFLCILGCFETKNVGRTSMLVRGAYVSDETDLDPVFEDAADSRVYALLDLEPAASPLVAERFVIVNEACIPVTRRCFDRIDLAVLKKELGRVECYPIGSRFLHVRYKIGLVFKRLSHHVWVTTNDEMYWVRRLMPGIRTHKQLMDRMGHDYATSYIVDLNEFYCHNTFPKNILAFNGLKNAILATDKSIARYFLDTVSAYCMRTPMHEAVVKPVEDGISHHFTMWVPRIKVAHYSYLGCNQEDCIVVRRGLTCFDCVRCYSIRFRVDDGGTGGFTFYPVKGDPNENFLGTVAACRPGGKIRVEPQSVHVRIEPISDEQAKIFFSKGPFSVVQYIQTPDSLVVGVEIFHRSDTSDKLCSFHGQKGVINILEDDRFPLLDENERPDAIVSPYFMYRCTVGQIKEGIERGNGHDAVTVRHYDENGNSYIVEAGGTFVAGILYFGTSILGEEREYAPLTNTVDVLTGQPLKGRSLNGGMKLGEMEGNAVRGKGLGDVRDEKLCEHSDGADTMIPKCVELIGEEAKFFKVSLQYQTTPLVQSARRKRSKDSDPDSLPLKR